MNKQIWGTLQIEKSPGKLADNEDDFTGLAVSNSVA
jgi:hypothetical protein